MPAIKRRRSEIPTPEGESDIETPEPEVGPEPRSEPRSESGSDAGPPQMDEVEPGEVTLHERHSELASTNRGRIKRLVVENFMCHDKFEMEFSPQVNVITGRNGSGKSTILTALMIGLGGSTRHTSRGENLGSLIKNGKSHAWIEVTIALPPGHMFYDKYRGQVTVQRHLRGKTATYTFKNAVGKAVVNKRPSEEVKLLCESCRFYFQNPLAVLTQEQAKFFLATAKPDRKYLELEKATRMFYVKEILENIEKDIADQQQTREDVLQREAECVRLEESDQQYFREQDEADATLTSFKQTLKWRAVRERRQSVAVLSKQKDEVSQKVLDTMALANGGRTPAEIQIDNDVAACNQQIEEARAQRDSQDSQVSQLQHQLDEKTAEVNRLEYECNSLTQKQERVLDQCSRLEREVEESNPAALQESRERLEREIEEAEDQIVATNAETDRLAVETADARVAHENAKPDMEPFRRQLKQIDEDISREKRSLEGLSSGQHTDYDAAYGRPMAELMRRIETSTWQKKPVGPLGRHVSVKDPKWTGVLEKLLSRTTHAFWVETDADRNELSRLMRSCKADFPIIKRQRDSSFTFEQRLIREDPRYTRLIDILVFDSAEIRNLFVDSDRIEAVALASSMQEAMKIMSTGSRDPRLNNVLYLNGTRNATRLSARGQTSTDSDTVDLWKGAYRMKTDNRSQVRQMQASIESRKAERARVTAQRDEEAASANPLKAKYDELRKQHADAQKREQSLSRDLRRLKSELRELPVNAVDHSAEIADLQRQRTRYTQHLAAAATHRASLAAELQNLEDKVERAKKGPLRAQSELERLESQLQQLFDNQRELEIQREDGNKVLRRLNMQHTRLNDDLTAQSAELEQAEEEAEAVGGDESAADAHTNSSNDTLEREIQHLTHVQSTNAALASEIELRREKRQTNLELLEGLRHILGDLGVTIGLRQESLYQHRENSHEVWTRKRRRMCKDFEQTLRKKLRYHSRLDIDDTRKRLSVDVDTGGGFRKAGTLSGGEKSFTQIALLMSIWKQLSVGFVAMDEYDVYMDKVNRLRSLMLLLETVQNKDIQCVLITPQDVEALALEEFEGDLKITRMDDPDR